MVNRYTQKEDTLMLITNEKQQINQDAVQAALDQFHRALNALFAGNISPMMTVWSHADDVTYMGPNGAYRVGWQEVLADWAAQAALRLGGSVEAEDVRIVTGPKLAVVHNRVTGANVDTAGNPLPVSLRATVILRQEAGNWKVIGVHTDRLPMLSESNERR